MATEIQIHDQNLNEVLDRVGAAIGNMSKVPKGQRKAVRIIFFFFNAIFSFSSSYFLGYSPPGTHSHWPSLSSICLQELDAIDADMKKAKNLLNLFELESRSVPPAERNLYKTKGKDHKKRMTDATQELTWIRNEDQKADLTGDRKADYAHDIRQLDANQAMNYGEKLQNESLASLDRSLASIDDSTKVGSETALALKNQTEQLTRIYDELYEIDDMLERSTAIVKKMLKTAGTDKCIWVFAFLLLCGIIATVIVSKVGPKNSLAAKVY